MHLSGVTVGLVLLWGVIAGLDFVSVLQGLLSRPLIAATVAGALVGNVSAGLMAGAVLELYALDVLPIGASRYPDFSVAAVATGFAAALMPIEFAPGIAGVVGLPMALLGGWSLQPLRRANAATIERERAALEHGDPAAARRVQHRGIVHDAMRSLALAVVGVGFAMLVVRLPWLSAPQAQLVSWAALAGGGAAALGGAIRSSGRGPRRRWLAVGLGLGIVAAGLMR